jgi:hypothetical protein
LIEKTETEETPPEETGEDPGQAFSFAKVWTADDDALEELKDQALEHMAATDSWAHALELIAKEQTQTKAAERTGRGVRRKAAIAAENQVQSVVLSALIIHSRPYSRNLTFWTHQPKANLKERSERNLNPQYRMSPTSMSAPT